MPTTRSPRNGAMSSAAERVLTFGFEQPADFMAHKVRSQSDAGGFRTDFELVTPYGSRPATLALGGLHNLRNALGAAAAACAVGVEIDEIVAGLAATKSVAGRLELKPALNGAFLVDDSYNANPSSLKAGLDAFRTFGGARWLVLGEMRELGDSADELHAEVGRYARQAGIERLFAVGERSRFAVEAFGPGAQLVREPRRAHRGSEQVAEERRRSADQGLAGEPARARRRGTRVAEAGRDLACCCTSHKNSRRWKGHSVSSTT